MKQWQIDLEAQLKEYAKGLMVNIPANPVNIPFVLPRQPLKANEPITGLVINEIIWDGNNWLISYPILKGKKKKWITIDAQ